MTNKISALSQFRNACRPYVKKLTGVASSLLTAKLGQAIIGGGSAAGAVGGSATLNASVQAGTIAGLTGTGAGSVLPNMLPLVDPAFTALNQAAGSIATTAVTGNVTTAPTIGTSIGVIGSGMQIVVNLMDISLGIPVSVLVAGTAVAGRTAWKVYQEHKRLPQNSQNIPHLEADAKKETPLLTDRTQNANISLSRKTVQPSEWDEFLKNHEKKIAFLACLPILTCLGINHTDYLRNLLTTDNPYKFMHLIREFPVRTITMPFLACILKIPEFFTPEHLESHDPGPPLLWLLDVLSTLGTAYLIGRFKYDVNALAKKFNKPFLSPPIPKLPPDYAKPIGRAHYGIFAMCGAGFVCCVMAISCTVSMLARAKKRKEPLDPDALSHLIDFFNAPSKENFGDGIEAFKFTEESPNRTSQTTGEYKKQIVPLFDTNKPYDWSKTLVDEISHKHPFAMQSIAAEYPSHSYKTTVSPQNIRYQPNPSLYRKHSHERIPSEKPPRPDVPMPLTNFYIEHTNVAHRFSNLMTHKFRVPEKLVQTVDGQEIGTLVEMDTKKYGAYKCFQSSRQEHPPINCYAEKAWKKWLSVNELAYPASSIRPLTSREQVEKFRLNYRFFD